jgi:YidC/Oxa1 family membrane protein insertase
MFVLFLLWQNWMEFQAKKHPPPTPPVATAPAGAPVSAAIHFAPSPGQDVPTAAPAGAARALKPSAAANGCRSTTDLFEAIEIDTLGGDLRRAGLRTYPESVQQPDQPFAVAEGYGAEIFIAQSGLLALNNGPAPNHYARFAPEQTEYRLADGQDTLDRCG